ncbi:MAG: hypothetical protein WCO04_00100 [Pseudomonadota bacterium]
MQDELTDCKKTNRKIFLHIGMHKTGSTAIQSAFHGYDNGRLLYAPLENENHSIPFYTAFSGDHFSYHIWQTAGLSDLEIAAKQRFYLKEIEQILSLNKDRDVFFSGEDISVISKSGVEQIASLFKKVDRDVTVIVYVRSPLSYATSALQEIIRQGSTNPVPERPDYRFKIEKFLDAFGCQNVLIRDFHDLQNSSGDVVRDISRLLNATSVQSVGLLNVGFSTEAIKVVCKINKVIRAIGEPGWARECRTRCINHVRSILPGKFEVPAHLMSACIDSDDIDWLRSVSGIDYRSDVSVARGQATGSLGEFLSEINTSTKDVIVEALLARDEPENLPQQTDPLILRYLLSFANYDERKLDPNRYV